MIGEQAGYRGAELCEVVSLECAAQANKSVSIPPRLSSTVNKRSSDSPSSASLDWPSGCRAAGAAWPGAAR